MASVRPHLRATIIAAAFLVFAASPLENQAAAQQNGANADRDDRGGRNGRRGGGPRGDRNGGPGGNRGDDNNRPAETKPAATPPAATSTANSFGTGSNTGSDAARKWASDTVAKYDKNNNKIIDGDEFKAVSSSTREADSDHDEIITINELVAFSSKSSSSASTPKPVAETVKKAESDNDKSERVIVNKSRKSYRFKTTKERLSTWRHASKDANGDGQVSMSEYSRSWTERTANEFKRLDKDNDGMITVEEAK